MRDSVNGKTCSGPECDTEWRSRPVLPKGESVTAYEIDPLADPRWERLALSHAKASVFHSQGWLKALRNAYGYEPIALTTTPPGRELGSGIVFCRVRSWLTGNRLVSLPFSDHCEPLVDSQAELDCLLSRLRDDPRYSEATYIEIRPMTSRFGDNPGFTKLEEFRLHTIDLRPSPEALFRRFHKNIQRNIRRAEGKHLRDEEGTSGPQLEHFRRLLNLTRRRHLLPAQPLLWFRSLLDCLGEQVTLRLAYKDDIPIAGILTLRHNDVMVYKYGCSDIRYGQFGGTALLLWRSIQEARKEGIREFDLGRSDPGNAGLVTFKERWGSTASTLTYWSCGAHRFDGTASRWTSRCVRQILPYLPARLFTTAGSLLYKHVG
jgi:CelD/BcsL family acetyltransferase involved in cellulose biosynthesis